MWRRARRYAVLTIDAVSKSYQQTRALDEVTFSVAAGSIVGLVGPNGAGKTTLIRICTGLLTSDQGTVYVGEHDVQSERRRALEDVGYAPQATGIYLERTVHANLRHFGRLVGLAGPRLEAAVDEVSVALELDDRMSTRAAHLSGGLRRRLHVGVALLGRPRLVILDEPTANVDIDSRRDLLELVRRLAVEGAAVLFSTHYLQEIEELSADVVMLLRGKVAASGTIDALVAEYGGDTLEVRFTQPPGELAAPVGFTVEVTDVVASYRSTAGGMDVGAILASLGPRLDIVAAVEVRRPSLDVVYQEMRRRTLGIAVVEA